jgi:phosphoribosylglycinamide formyltransferase-1
MSPPLKLAVLVSGGGTTLQNLLDVITAGQLDAEVRVVIGSKPGIKGLQRAADARVMNFVVQRSDFESLEAFSAQVFKLIEDAEADLVVLGGWLSLLRIPPSYIGRVINIHPALLPSFGGKGMYGRRVHEAAIAHGCKISGCTVHFVDDTYDNGPIILQRTCPVEDDDTPESLAARVFEQEKIAYPEAIRLFQRGALKIDGRRVRVVDEVPPVPPPAEGPAVERT